METPSKKLVIIVVVALIAVAVGGVVAWGYTHHGDNGQYNYTYTYESSFTDKDGITHTAQDGRKYVIVNIVLQNDSFEPGINTNVMIMVWKLTLNRMTFEPDAVSTTEHPNYWSIVLQKGGKWGYTVIFEIPQEAEGKKDFSIGYSYTSLGDKPSLTYNKDLQLTSA